MIIRRAEKGDLEGINELLRQVLYVHHVGRPDIFKEEGKKYCDEELLEIIGDDTKPLFVAVEGDRVLGHCFTMITEVRDHSSLMDMKTLYIDDLCVHKDERGTGVGSQLYEYALAFAKSIGCYNVTLNVWAKNEAAMKFYLSKGLSVQKTGMEIIL